MGIVSLREKPPGECFPTGGEKMIGSQSGRWEHHLPGCFDRI
ncbi:hypothetical protein BREVNS_0274 [Brevinematales bacterium NS]|nr:hypothetical protein BREVNS_0274 [Brevinematales bacterium NS]